MGIGDKVIVDGTVFAPGYPDCTGSIVQVGVGTYVILLDRPAVVDGMTYVKITALAWAVTPI